MASLDKTTNYVLVPKYATEEMKLMGARSIGQTFGWDNHTERAQQCWDAMVDAFFEGKEVHKP